MRPPGTRITVHLSPSIRQRLKQLANRDGLSPADAAGRLIEAGLAREAGSAGLVPALDDFREVRAALSRSMRRRTTALAANQR